MGDKRHKILINKMRSVTNILVNTLSSIILVLLIVNSLKIILLGSVEKRSIKPFSLTRYVVL